MSIIQTKDQSKPSYKLKLNPIEYAFNKENFQQTFKKHTQTPKERFTRPQTANQEIGWYSRPLMNNSKWDKHLKSTHISNYVCEYSQLKGINPFSIKPSRLPLTLPPKYFSSYPYDSQFKGSQNIIKK